MFFVYFLSFFFGINLIFTSCTIKKEQKKERKKEKTTNCFFVITIILRTVTFSICIFDETFEVLLSIKVNFFFSRERFIYLQLLFNFTGTNNNRTYKLIKNKSDFFLIHIYLPRTAYSTSLTRGLSVCMFNDA